MPASFGGVVVPINLSKSNSTCDLLLLLVDDTGKGETDADDDADSSADMVCASAVSPFTASSSRVGAARGAFLPSRELPEESSCEDEEDPTGVDSATVSTWSAPLMVVMGNTDTTGDPVRELDAPTAAKMVIDGAVSLVVVSETPSAAHAHVEARAFESRLHRFCACVTIRVVLYTPCLASASLVSQRRSALLGSSGKIVSVSGSMRNPV